MLRTTFVIAAFLAGTAVANAEPLKLEPNQMDQVTAGSVGDTASTFGATRSEDASTTYNPNNYDGNIGDFFSDRKGNNADRNLDFLRNNSGLPVPDLN